MPERKPGSTPHVAVPADLISDRIRNEGPIDFAAFMDMALYGPGGFFRRAVVGRDAHFVTSPHVHPVFATLLARLVREMWRAQGDPESFTLVELGAGDGTLARGLIGELADIPLRYVGVEIAEESRRSLTEIGCVVLPSIEHVGAIGAGCILANELLDNLPFRRVRRNGAGGLLEMRVGLERGGGSERSAAFIEVERELDLDDRPFVLAAEGLQLEPGQEGVVPLEAMELIGRISQRLPRGHALFVDYGFTHPSDRGHVHGYRDQRLVEDVLSHPGWTDITAGVDLAALAAHATSLGCTVGEPATQHDALLSLGYGDWDTEMREKQDSLREQDSLASARVYGERSEASLLVDRTGLGELIWLPMATGGLDPLP